MDKVRIAVIGNGISGIMSGFMAGFFTAFMGAKKAKQAQE